MEIPEIHSAAQSGNYEQLKRLLKEDTQLVNVEDWKGQKPLHYAAENSLECVEFLIKNGADVNERDRNGYTAIFRASTVEIAKVLIENGANYQYCRTLVRLITILELFSRCYLFGTKSRSSTGKHIYDHSY